ncbi:MAG TPA: pentapeptide repeat-containing protein [Candidatus Saccharimonadales bacterium]|nr:pentapeptide repeat-containing protein [Candidatus Saccharimonadales bacterium]
MKKKTATRTQIRAHHAPHFYVLFAFVMIVIGAFGAIVVSKVVGETANNVIYACSQKQTGNLRMVAAGSVCKPDEVGVSWNVQGPAGPAGSSGGSSEAYNGLPYTCYNCNLSPFASKFAGKDFTGAQLLNCYFINADLTGVIFKNGNLDQCIFTGSNLTNADLSNITPSYGLNYINDWNLKSVNLTGANLSNDSIANGKFQNANLQNTNFSNANLYGGNFAGAQNMSSANVTGTKWTGVTCPDGSNSDGNGGTCVGHF